MDSGLTKEQASEVLTQLAFYAGWPGRGACPGSCEKIGMIAGLADESVSHFDAQRVTF
jgi:hypothetical protein